ncbi:MAG: four helix bundle protein [Candidatus Pacebacteria bacterium]|nr:four helix bundle protein [Candidatus Paceibacterota bacterium]
MRKLHSRHSLNRTPPSGILPVLERVKSTYLQWVAFHQTLPKIHRYTLGARIDTLFVEIIEAAAVAAFLSPQEKLPWVRLAIRKLDALKILLMVLWETKSLGNKKYIMLSKNLDEIGRMFGGWFGQLTKQNSPRK